MITYKDLFKVLKAGGYVWAMPETETYEKIMTLWRRGIVDIDEDLNYRLTPEQVKRLASSTTPPIMVVSILSSPTESPITAPSSDLGRVRVDWSGRGMSSGSYKVVADKGKFLEIAFELDVERKMTVSKTRTAAA
jgi:hypothetical protein